jgi:hypothetical protein
VWVWRVGVCGCVWVCVCVCVCGCGCVCVLPHPGGGEVPAGSPSAIGDPSRQPQGHPHRLFSLLRERDQVKDPRKNWGLSDTCQLELVISSLSKAKCFKITALST